MGIFHVKMAKNAGEPTTHSCFRFAILLAQCFGLFPVVGVTEPDCSFLNFKWTSMKVLYTFTILFGLSFQIFFHVYRAFHATGNFKIFVPVMFFGCCFLTTLAFLHLARFWPEILRKWTEVDKAMKSYGFPKKLKRKLVIVTIVVMSAAALEHSLFIWNGINSVPAIHRGQAAFDSFLYNNFENVFTYLPYRLWAGLLLQLISLYSTFTWNYADLFIMLVSIALSARFKQISQRLQCLSLVKVRNETVWMIIREDYDRLSKLCKMLDEAISNVTFLSFANNLFFIIIQLSYSVDGHHKKSTIGYIYYIYSFTFLITRTVLVTLYAGKIDHESREPGSILMALPCDVYNTEIERFLHQVKIDPSAFTGKGLFRVQKSLILSIAGAVVTYELILIQFNQVQ